MPQEAYNMTFGVTKVLNDYNGNTMMSPSDFVDKYRGNLLGTVFKSTSVAFDYLNSMYQNMADQPVETTIAVLSAGLLAYTGSRALRFIRQKGQGSTIQKLERKLGNKLFGGEE